MESQSYDITMTSEASSIVISPSVPSNFISLNTNFPKPPVVTVYNYWGKPISNATVVAFSWPEPKFYG